MSFGPRTVRSREARGAPSLRGSGSGFHPHVVVLEVQFTHRQVMVGASAAGVEGEVENTTMVRWSPNPYQMVHEGTSALGGDHGPGLVDVISIMGPRAARSQMSCRHDVTLHALLSPRLVHQNSQL